jgi:hypothetical protein
MNTFVCSGYIPNLPFSFSRPLWCRPHRPRTGGAHVHFFRGAVSSVFGVREIAKQSLYSN